QRPRGCRLDRAMRALASGVKTPCVVSLTEHKGYKGSAWRTLRVRRTPPRLRSFGRSFYPATPPATAIPAVAAYLHSRLSLGCPLQRGFARPYARDSSPASLRA